MRTKEQIIDNLFYKVIDSEAPLDRCPAMTTLLYKVCSQEDEKFEEAIRLITLFMEAAYDEGFDEANSNIGQETIL